MPLGARILHLFSSQNSIDLLLSKSSLERIFLSFEDFSYSKNQLSDGCFDRDHVTDLNSKAECSSFLNAVVERIWQQLRKQLNKLDRTSVIRKTLEVHEAVLQDRVQWHRTTKALLALYRTTEDVKEVAHKQELDRVQVSLSARTILEMAICECPIEHGSELSRWQLDRLLTQAALLLEVATDSDAVHSGLIVSPKITIHKNGEYTIARTFKKFVEQYHSAHYSNQLEQHVKSYEDFYLDQLTGSRTLVKDSTTSDFLNAFEAEFGLTLNEAVDLISGLMDFAVELDNVIIQSTVYDLKSWLATRKGLSSDAINAFIRSFSIVYRPAWNQPPIEFEQKDIYPWRYDRRLSVTARPILILSECESASVIYGVGSLMRSYGYLLAGFEQGRFPSEMFKSSAMRSYVGSKNNELGHEFAQDVAQE